MHPLPELAQWQPAREGLHGALVVLRSARHLEAPELPNHLSYGTIPTPWGATTGPLAEDMGDRPRLDLDYGAAKISVVRAGRTVAEVAVDGDLEDIFDSALDALASAGLSGKPDRSKLERARRLHVPRGSGGVYAEAQWRMHGLLARLRSDLLGFQTPITLWPHGFDLSTLAFATGDDETRDPHLNLGFSPGTPDVGEPYVYAYAWPELDPRPGMPPGIEWQSEWPTPGLVLRWSRLAGFGRPDDEAFELLRPVVGEMAASLRDRARERG